MKRRRGLVSNSSSSSFMCTFGKIIDKEKFETWQKANKLKFDTLLGEELIYATEKELWNNDRIAKFFYNLEYDFFDQMLSRDSIIKEIERDPKAIYVIAGGEGSGGEEFYWDGDEYDYDKVYEDHFLSNVEALYSANKEQGFKNIDSCCYAGRNG
jgi:hypothetical protein